MCRSSVADPSRARIVIAGTDTNYVLAGARQDTTALRAIPLG